MLPRNAYAVVFVLSSAPSVASAQVTGEPSAVRFYRAPGASSFIGVDDARVAGHLQPSLTATFDYAHRPMSLDDVRRITWDPASGTPEPPSRNDELDVVGGMSTIQLTGALTLFERLQVGVNLPIVANTFGDSYSWQRCATDGTCRPAGRLVGGHGATLGDPRVHVLFSILGGSEIPGFGLALAGWVTFPTARAILPNRYAGDPGIAAGGHVVASYATGPLRLSVNLGGAYHPEAQVILSRRTSELTWGAAGQSDFDEQWSVVVEAQGGTTFGLVYDNEAPTELRAAGQVRVDDFVFRLGAGAGLAYAIGVPIVRVFAEGSFAARPDGDQDGDRITDRADACPTDAEDLDGFADEDGCPELDNDSDGIPDAEDRCVAEREDRDDHDDADGCPDPDDDGDGIQDGFDSCPAQPEDVDGDRDHDGCPDHDRDGDHLTDEVDRCPAEAEDTDGLGDEDGCPEEDFDQDTVLDTNDVCPEQAEDVDGFEDEDGCPEEASAPSRPRRGRGR